MFGQLGQLGSMMKNFQNIQKNMKTMKDELANFELSAKSSCGQVEVLVSGDLRIKKVYIQPALIARNDAAALEQAVLEAVNNALNQAKAAAAEKLSLATGGMELPGI